MLYLDYLAYHNRFAAVSVAEKLLLGGGALMIAVTFAQTVTQILIMLVMNGVILASGTPPGYLARLWLAPAGFLAASLLAVFFSVSSTPFPAYSSFQIGAWYIGITGDNLVMAYTLALRSLAAVSCLLMLATTTPVAYAVALLSRFAVLRPFVEITLLTYRFIFVVLSTAGQIYTAQQSRLGYSSWRRSLSSISVLAACLGRKSFLTARDLFTALTARNYQDRLVFRYPSQNIHSIRLAFIAVILAALALTAFI